MRFVFLGPPGAGKGTQAARAAEHFSLPHLSTGAMLRTAIDQGTVLGQKVAEIVGSGGLVDDQTIIDLISSTIKDQNSFILDGFPRTLEQGKALRSLLLNSHKPLTGVLLFEVDEKAVLERIQKRARQEGRKDDTDEIFKRRLKLYHADTEPLLAFYRAEGLVQLVDGMKDISSVELAVNAILKRFLEANGRDLKG